MTANADVWNKKTIVTFREPVEVPGTVLEPGRYVMKLADSPSNRHIVQIMNERENHVYTTTLAIPNYRAQPAEKTVLTFYEMPADTPQALRAWFYPGDNVGQEFAYPKIRAAAISTMARLHVPAVDDHANATPAATPTEAPTPTEPPLQAAAEPTEPATDAAEPEPAPAQERPVIAQAAPAPLPQRTPSDPLTPSEQPAVKELPEGASAMPALALLGLVSLGSAITLRFVNRRSA